MAVMVKESARALVISALKEAPYCLVILKSTNGHI